MIVFEHNGKQYNLKKEDENEIIYLPYQKNTKPGGKITFSKVLSDGDNFGHPYLDVEIFGEVVKHGLKRKIYILGYKAKKRQVGNNLKGQGHREKYTEVKITDIKRQSQFLKT